MSLTELTADETKFFESGGQASPEPEQTVQPVVQTPVQPTEPEDKTVPLAALHEARQIQKELREANKKAQEEARIAREKAEKMEQTFQTFLAEKTKQQAPKYEEDPLGALKYENDQLSQKLETVNTSINKQQEEWSRAQQYQAFAQSVQTQEATFKQTNPDYDQAVAYLKSARLQTFSDMGFSPEESHMALQNEIVGLAQAAIQRGKNPAEIAYKEAQRYGYKAQKNEPEKTLETLAKGQEASKTLAGGKADVALTLDALSQLDDEQLDALIKDDKAWAKLGR